MAAGPAEHIKEVPSKLRQLLNLESGINNGLVLLLPSQVLGSHDAPPAASARESVKIFAAE
ncbi:putative integral membrane protein MviN [Streptomyces sp. NBRC 110611]|nr:putative integral membrane protein MviN [Streptomyces sp. NBRC 110611]